MAELELVPVKTRILTEKDNIVDAIEEYTQGQIGPDDLLCVAESVVAITQRRFTRPEELKPSWQARLMRRFVPGEGSMASLYGMQAAMELEGEWKMLVCFIIGFIAKLFGKDGVWYRLCRQASLTDDVTGTMPPFDKCIVYGPADPMGVAEKIKKRLGCYGACVADV
ncbi:MAG: coenzyme F420-0:L-glutamate ligase, partial [Megasphaera micronuciformis]|nr:coenzyme F420-0:L-glutamate ligase [Megasphaera micronuciformis]